MDDTRPYYMLGYMIEQRDLAHDARHWFGERMAELQSSGPYDYETLRNEARCGCEYEAGRYDALDLIIDEMLDRYWEELDEDDIGQIEIDARRIVKEERKGRGHE